MCAVVSISVTSVAMGFTGEFMPTRLNDSPYTTVVDIDGKLCVAAATSAWVAVTCGPVYAHIHV
jgi:hypothetical protein